MAYTLEYIFSLQDKISAKVGNITITSDKMLGKFADLEKKTSSLNKTFADTGRTMGALRDKIALLQAEREWIPADNIEGIRAYNREIKSLHKEIDKLEALNGGKFKKWGKEAFAALPFSNFISNPLVAGAAAIGFSGKSAMNFDEGMAKVNITAELDETELSGLKTQLKQIATDNKTDILIAPVGFEKINSQLNDVDLSLSILDASLKGSKAGFTDLDTVSGALAQTLSIVGKENATAQEVLDTFFAAKRVGAGEFADFARYMPNLIAGASNLGINFKEVAGTFAYMTGKGQSAERAAVLMENAFSVLGRADIRGKMEKAGIKVFDEQGKIRGVVDIFGDLQRVLSGFNDEQKSSLLEKFGLVDKEAKNAFAVLTSDVTKLQESMDGVVNSSGETDKALNFSKNSMQKATEVWNQFKNIGMGLGEIILPLICVGLDVAGSVLNGVCSVLDTVNGLFSWWFTQLQTGNSLIWGITAAIGALSVALISNCIQTNAITIALRAMYLWDSIVAGATWLWTTAQWALNAAFLASPLGWIVLGVGAVVAAIVYCWQKFEGFRRVILGTWEVVKEFGRALFDSIVTPFKQILSGIGSVTSALISLIKGDFSEAAGEAKKGFKDIAGGLLNTNPISVGIKVLEKGNFADAWKKGKQNGTENWIASQNKKNKKGVPDSIIPEPLQAVPVNYNSLLAKLGKQKGKGEKTLNLNDKVQNYNATSEYITVTQKIPAPEINFNPMKLSGAGEKVQSLFPIQPVQPDGDKKVDENIQEYVTDKTNTLQDIMLNVRKIAAVIAIPLAISLSSPSQAKETVNPVPEIPMPTALQANVTAPPQVVQAPEVPHPPAPMVSVPEILMPTAPQANVTVPPQVVQVPEVPQPSAPMVSVPEIPMPTAPQANVTVPPQVLQVPEVPQIPAPMVSVQNFNNSGIQLPEPSADAYEIGTREKISESTSIFNQEINRETSKSVQVDRICDQIVINIQNTDNKGQEVIRTEVMNVLREICEYEV